jgi:hypothetical protein
MDQYEEHEAGPVGSDEPIPHAMPTEQWERIKAEMAQQQK